MDTQGSSERSAEIYTRPHVTQTARGKLLHCPGRSAGCSVMTRRGGWRWVGGGSVLCDDPEQWMEVGGLNREWIYVYIQLIHFAVQQKHTAL